MLPEEADGPISGLLLLVALNLAPLERIPLVGIPFVIIDFILGFMAGLIHLTGLK